MSKAYYLLHHDEYLTIRSQLKPNELDIYLYLITKHPFQDSKLEIDTALISEQLGYHRRTVQLAIKKLASLDLLEVEITKFKYRQARHGYQSRMIRESVDRSLCKTPVIRESTDRLSESTDRLSESTDRLSESTDRQQTPKPPPEAVPEPSQIIQTIQTSQTGGGVENSQLDPVLDLVNKKVDDTEQNYSEQATDNEEKLVNNKNSGKDQSSASVVQVTTKRVTSQEISPEAEAEAEAKAKAKAKKITHEAADIPEDLISKLKDLGITIDGEVKRAIADHDISQAYGAIKHVENTWETINNPRGVFLFQIPKQRVQKGPPPISEGFLDWYQWAISDGLVIDYPARYLPTNFKGEPKVKLVIDPHWAEDWEKVRDNPDDYRQKLDPKVKKQLWAKLGTMLGRPPKPEPEPTLNDQLNDPILGPELYPKIKHSHHIDFTESGRPYQATPITDIEYDAEGFPKEEMK